jgi:hypothetical protein
VRAQGQGTGAARLRGRHGRSPTRRAVRPGGRDDARVPPVGGARRREVTRAAVGRWWAAKLKRRAGPRGKKLGCAEDLGQKQ